MKILYTLKQQFPRSGMYPISKKSFRKCWKGWRNIYTLSMTFFPKLTKKTRNHSNAFQQKRILVKLWHLLKRNVKESLRKSLECLTTQGRACGLLSVLITWLPSVWSISCFSSGLLFISNLWMNSQSSEEIICSLEREQWGFCSERTERSLWASDTECLPLSSLCEHWPQAQHPQTCLQSLVAPTSWSGPPRIWAHWPTRCEQEPHCL